MAIVNMISNQSDEFPEGAYCPFGPGSYNDPRSTRNLEYAIVLYRSHHGLCLFEREANGYNDSDFYMTVWDPEKKSAREICFATTRGWSYPCYASAADAPPEIHEKYKVWKTEQDRQRAIRMRWHQRGRDIELAAELQIPRSQLRKIKRVGQDRFTVIRSILKVKNFRSEFRRSLNEQIRKWLEEEKPKFPSPLSRRQWECLGIY